MNYEKKYKDALAHAREIHRNEEEKRKDMEFLFPELKESEDERIRKMLIKFFGNGAFCDSYTNGISDKDIVAWLEKQGEKSTLNGEGEKIKEEIINFFECQSREEPTRKDTHNKWITWLKRQGEQDEPQVYVTADGDIITYSETEGYTVIEPKFHEGDWIACEELNTAKIINIVDDKYEVEFIDGNKGFPHIEYIDRNFHLWTIQDAKDGDVLFHSDSASNGIFIFKEIIDKGFAKEVICYCDYDSEDHFCLGEHHTCCWTDAKILYPATKEQRDTLKKAMADAGYTFDFEKKKPKEIEQKSANKTKQKFNIGDEIKTSNEKSLTITKIDGKGYWSEDLFICSFEDSAKWKLVRQKPEWSEDDEQYLLVCKNALKKYQVTDKWDSSIISQWLDNKLKSLRSQKQWKPSDEQLDALQYIYKNCFPPLSDKLGWDSIRTLELMYQDLRKLREE